MRSLQKEDKETMFSVLFCPKFVRYSNENY